MNGCTCRKDIKHKMIPNQKGRNLCMHRPRLMILVTGQSWLYNIPLIPTQDVD